MASTRVKVTNSVAIGAAVVAILAMLGVGAAVGTAAPPSVDERIGTIRVEPKTVDELILSADERGAILEGAGIEIQSVRNNVSSAVIPSSVSPELCTDLFVGQVPRGGRTIGVADAGDATVSFESSALLYATPDEARQAIESIADRRQDECASITVRRVDTSLGVTQDTISVVEGQTTSGVDTYDFQTEFTFSDGFVQRQRMMVFLVGNAALTMAYGLNQPIVDAPWGDDAIEEFSTRIDEFVDASISVED